MFPVERQHVLFEKQRHLAHGVFNLLCRQLALPDNDDLPSAAVQQIVVLAVPLLVATDFGDPKLAVGTWNLAARRILHTLTH